MCRLNMITVSVHQHKLSPILTIIIKMFYTQTRRYGCSTIPIKNSNRRIACLQKIHDLTRSLQCLILIMRQIKTPSEILERF